MKLAFLILFFIPLFMSAQGDQKEKSNPGRLSVKEYDLNAEESEPSRVKLPFSSIKVIDSRYDTSIIGFVDVGMFGGKANLYKKLHIKDGCANAIEIFLNTQFQNSFDSSGMVLLIVLKKFWFSCIEYKKNRDLDLSVEILNSTKSLHCKWEYYLGKDDKYLPVKRVDTVWILKDNIDEHVKAKFERKQKEFLRASLQKLVEMLDFTKGVQVFDQQKKTSMQEIINFNEARFKIPILINDGVTQGIFVNFDEFRNNKPSIILFKEKKQSIGRYDQKFVEDENGRQINPYWAYFNGLNIIHGKFGNSILYRTQNTFAFFYRRIWNSFNNSQGTLFPTTRNEDWIPYEIDMETGEIY